MLSYPIINRTSYTHIDYRYSIIRMKLYTALVHNLQDGLKPYSIQRR